MNVEKYKVELAKKNKLNKIPKNIELNLINKFGLVTKPVRTQSGVAPVAIMTEPRDCPHNGCIYCPGGIKSYFGDVPRSYTGNEPATMRAIRNKFDAYLQVFNRLEHYVLLGHVPEKAELIIMGGTFLSYPANYQEKFITDAFKALNDFGKLFFKDHELDENEFKRFFEYELNFKSEERKIKLQKKILELKKESSLEAEQEKNEVSKIKCVALCLETRPDYCFEKDINQALKLGATRIEVGVQNLNNKILNLINRGHTVEDTIKATQLLKDSFLKCVYHAMPGLPGSNKEGDIEMFKELFSNPDFKPDGLKIYPCMVMPGTKLEEEYKKGKFNPLNTKDAVEILIKGKKYIPKYCRVYRVQRDVATKFTVSGVDRTNLRQYLHEIMNTRNIKCNCIRCREPKSNKVNWDNLKLNRIDYEASHGKEIFLSFDNDNILLGFLRLRIPFKPFRKEITSKSAGIREMHVYGGATSIGKKGEIQHRGLGKKLLIEAERIAKEEFDKNKMLIISGIGVKEYFKKFGYNKEGVYVSKTLER